jgi:hypothetical protein
MHCFQFTVKLLAFIYFVFHSLICSAATSEYRIMVNSVKEQKLGLLKSEAEELLDKLELDVYITFQFNFFNLEAGNFNQHRSAVDTLQEIHPPFPNALIVPTNDVPIVAYRLKGDSKWTNLTAININKIVNIDRQFNWKKTNDLFATNCDAMQAKSDRLIPSPYDSVPDLFPVVIYENDRAKKRAINFKSYLKNIPEIYHNPKYNLCNTAKNTSYLSAVEKDAFFFLNLARVDPKRFAKYFLKKDSENSNNCYEQTLYKTMIKMAPRKPLHPNRGLFEIAKCHAITSGENGYVGHDTQEGCADVSKTECCSYGMNSGLSIVLQLLVDPETPSLGHRLCCLGNYAEMGISVKPHKKHGVNGVLEFKK